MRRYAAFGEDPAIAQLKAELLVQFDRVLDQLADSAAALRRKTEDIPFWQLALLGPFAFFGQIWNWSTPAATRDGIRISLGTIDELIRLRRQSANEVVAGRLAFSKWIASATTVLEGIGAVARYLEEGSTINLATQQFRSFKAKASAMIDKINAMLEALGRAGEKIADNVEIILPLVGVAAVGVVLWKILR